MFSLIAAALAFVVAAAVGWRITPFFISRWNTWKTATFERLRARFVVALFFGCIAGGVVLILLSE